MSINNFLDKLNNEPHNISFEETMVIIDQNYNFTPCEFKNGNLLNAENENNGSCKIFAFAQLQGVTEEQTLHYFGDYYRKDVLQNPDATDHQNIRNFITTGWSGISFSSNPLSPK